MLITCAGRRWGQLAKGLLGGPFPFHVNSRLVTGEGPQIVNPALTFGAARGDDMRAVDDFIGGPNAQASCYPYGGKFALVAPFCACEEDVSERGNRWKFGHGDGR